MKIYFVDTCHPSLIENLQRDGHQCIEAYDISEEKLKLEIGDAEGMVIRSRIFLGEDFLQHAVKLKFIARAGSGMECIDTSYTQSRNIVCLNSPEGNMDAVGEHAIGMLLSLLNNLNRADRQVRIGNWIREENRGHELQGKTVGIIGYGNMGSAFAAKLHGFGCEVIAYDKYKTNFGSVIARECSLEDIFETTDVLSIHVPLTRETNYFIDDAFIQKFKKKIYLLNMSRGKCIRTDDLVKNLKSGKVIGACLDVIEYEDTSFEKFRPEDFSINDSWNYLVQSEQVILSPHIAGWTFESLEKIAQVLLEKIRSFIRSEK